MQPVNALPRWSSESRFGSLPSSGRDRPAQLVPLEVQAPQVSEAPKFRRELSRQAVGFKAEFRNPPGPVRGHAVPLAKRPVAQPVRAALPVHPPRRLEERDEHGAVRGHAALGGLWLTERQAESGGPILEQVLQAHGDAPGQPVVPKVDGLEVREVGQLGRDLAAQPVVRHPQVAQAREAAQLSGDRTVESVPVESQQFKAGETTELGRNRPAQIVGVENEPFKAGETTKLGRDRTAQVVAGEEQHFQAGQAAQFRRDRSAQLVLVKPYPSQVREQPQLYRDRTAQPVSSEVQRLELRETAHLGRDRSAQPVRVQVEPRDTAVAVGVDAVPLAKRPVGQPV